MTIQVYVIAERRAENPVKIGYAADIGRRIAALQIGNHRVLEVRGSRECSDEAEARAVEAAVHGILAAQRLSGEWFDVTVDDALVIMRGVSFTPAPILPAHRIIAAFGGSRAMAAWLSIGNIRYAPTTVQSWKDAGGIPVKHQAWVLERGRELGKPITPDDFFRVPSIEEQRAAS